MIIGITGHGLFSVMKLMWDYTETGGGTWVMPPLSDPNEVTAAETLVHLDLAGHTECDVLILF